MRLGRPVRLLVEIGGAAEPLADRVHVVAVAVVRALDRRCALQPHLCACLLAGVAVVLATVTVHVEAARAVAAWAAGKVGAAPGVLLGAAHGRRHWREWWHALAAALAPEVRLAPLARLSPEVLVAAELLQHRVHVVAAAVVRALDCGDALESDPVAGLRACVAVVFAAVAIDIDAARAVEPRAGNVVAAAARVLLRLTHGRGHRDQWRRQLAALAPVVRLVRLVRLPRQVLIAAELLPHRVHVAAMAVVRALDGLEAAEADPGTGLRARHATVTGAMAVDVDATRAVRPRAGDLVAAAAAVPRAGSTAL